MFLTLRRERIPLSEIQGKGPQSCALLTWKCRAPIQARGAVVSGFSDDFDPHFSEWGEMATSWKEVPILGQMGTTTTRENKPIQPPFIVAQGWGMGRKPCGHRGAGHPQDAVTTRLWSG